MKNQTLQYDHETKSLLAASSKHEEEHGGGSLSSLQATIESEDEHHHHDEHLHHDDNVDDDVDNDAAPPNQDYLLWAFERNNEKPRPLTQQGLVYHKTRACELAVYVAVGGAVVLAVLEMV